MLNQLPHKNRQLWLVAGGALLLVLVTVVLLRALMPSARVVLMDIDSEPAGASIVLNGVETHEHTPRHNYRYQLKDGESSIKVDLSLPGYEPAMHVWLSGEVNRAMETPQQVLRWSVTLSGGPSPTGTPVTVPAEPIPVTPTPTVHHSEKQAVPLSIEISSAPPEATVEINGKPEGKTPLLSRVISVREDGQPITITVKKKEFSTETRRWTATEIRTQLQQKLPLTWHAVLKEVEPPPVPLPPPAPALKCTLTVEGTPKGASLSIAGKVIGRTPLREVKLEPIPADAGLMAELGLEAFLPAERTWSAEELGAQRQKGKVCKLIWKYNLSAKPPPQPQPRPDCTLPAPDSATVACLSAAGTGCRAFLDQHQISCFNELERIRKKRESNAKLSDTDVEILTQVYMLMLAQRPNDKPLALSAAYFWNRAAKTGAEYQMCRKYAHLARGVDRSSDCNDWNARVLEVRCALKARARQDKSGGQAAINMEELRDQLDDLTVELNGVRASDLRPERKVCYDKVKKEVEALANTL